MIELQSSEGKELSTSSVLLTIDEESFEVTDAVALKELGEKIQEGKAFTMEFEDDSVLFMPVESSNIGHIHWSKNNLLMTFKGKNGFSVYGYNSVSRDIVMRLANAESIGKEFHKVKGDLGEYVRFI